MATFVFVLSDESKEPTDENDPNTWVLKYARARHTDVQVYRVLSVEEAIDIMLKELGSGGKTLEKVYIYTHSAPSGFVWGRLRTNEPNPGTISVSNAENFLNSSNKVSALSKYSNASTKVYFRGCNLGNNKKALMIWRDIFGGKLGSGSAADMYMYYGLELCPLQATRNRQVVLTKMISHTRDVASMIQELKNKYKESDDVWQKYEKKLNDDLNKWLTERYNLLKNGGELPPNMINIPNDQVVEKMRSLFNNHGGLPNMRLMPNIPPAGINPRITRQQLRTQGAIFPEDPGWSAHIMTVP
ncbi:MAG: hypothetical protein H3Z53_02585 [archaeon]|nr:hypothetical protein [archaeon]MCP8313247.1 hypothetical protein [archaeon]MCP8319802.1 hypothetical protein [archaeon]